MSNIYKRPLAHPAVSLAYGLAAMVLVMAFVQPLLVGVAFLGVASFGLLLDGWRACLRRLVWQAPVVFALGAMNALFVQRGATVLLQAPPVVVHAESLAYGLCMGLALVCVMEAFALLGEAVPGDEALSIAAGRAPACALLVSMTLRLVPKMRRDAQECLDVAAACTAVPEGGRGAPAGAKTGILGRGAARVRGVSRVLSCVLGSSLEGSLVRADSMRARGYGCLPARARTCYRRRAFVARDGLALACVVALFALAVATVAPSAAGFSFYPRIEGGAGLAQAVPFAAFFLLPHVAYVAERLRWEGGARGAAK